MGVANALGEPPQVALWVDRAVTVIGPIVGAVGQFAVGDAAALSLDAQPNFEAKRLTQPVDLGAPMIYEPDS